MGENSKFYTKPLREQVCDYLKKNISSHAIRPGDVINLRHLSQELGISITPLRDALLQLEGEGMVNILPRKGISLRQFSLRDVENYYDVIATLECHALETAVNNMTEADCLKMQEINDQIMQCARGKCYDDSRNLNKEFHCVYLGRSDNSYIETLWTNTWLKLFYCPTNIVNSLDWEIICYNQHASLVEAIRAKDMSKIAHCIKEEHWSFKNQKSYILKYYDLPETTEQTQKQQ